MSNQYKVLCVCPSFPPIAYPDCLRLTSTLPYFQEFGWDATVLCVDSKFVEGPIDLNLLALLPSNINIIQSHCIPPEISRKFGISNLAIRSLPFLLNSTQKYFSEGRFDLVFFSTTVFLSMLLGRYWLWKYKIPYIIDFQDPWLSDYYELNKSKPPGGLQKYKIARAINKILEPFTLKKVSHIISVSPEYPKVLMQRYSWLTEDQFTVLPFGAAEKDFELLSTLNIIQKLFNRSDGYRHWVYVGRGGADMGFALRSLFLSLQQARKQEPQKYSNLKLHFIGTDYAPGDLAQKTVEPIAIQYGLEDMVDEHPHRIPYFEALQCIIDANALIIPGSDDPGYTASKIYPYILAKKPLLAIFNEQSSVVDVLRSTQAGIVVTFRTGDTIETIATCITHQWLNQKDWTTPQTKWEAFFPYTAQEMTRRLCEVFDRSLELH